MPDDYVPTHYCIGCDQTYDCRGKPEPVFCDWHDCDNEEPLERTDDDD